MFLSQTCINEENKYTTKCFQLYNKDFNKKNIKIIKNYWTQQGLDPKLLIVDFKNNLIIARSFAKKINYFKKFLKNFDKKDKLIEIGLTIINTKEEFDFQFGINWSGIYNRLSTIKLNQSSFNFVGAGGALLDIPTPTTPVIPDYVDNLYVNPYNWAINLFEKPFNIDTLPPDNTTFFPVIFGGPDLNTRRLNALINANESSKKLQIISKSKILCTNNSKNKITIGTSLPFYETTILSLPFIKPEYQQLFDNLYNNLATGSFYFQDIGIILSIKPKICDINKIDIQIKAYISRVISGDTIYIPAIIIGTQIGVFNSNPPVIEIFKFKQNVILNNNETKIITGFNKSDKSENYNKVPLLNKIPIIGEAFKNTLEKKNTQNFNMFITPRIIK